MHERLSRRIVGGLIAGAVAVAAVALTGPSAQAATKDGAYAAVGFRSSISGVETDLDGLLEVLDAHTDLTGGSTTGAERMVFVYGIGHGSEVSAPVVSETVVLTPGKTSFVATGSGPIDSPWEAFEEPALGFEEPALGFEEPALGFGDPLRRSMWVDVDDPAEGLAGIWGTGNVGIDPDDYGLVLFSMSDPDAATDGDASYRAAIVPFEVRER